MSIGWPHILRVGAVLTWVWAVQAHAGPDYTAADIIKHFGGQPAAAEAPGAALPDTGTRSVHLGATGFGQPDTAAGAASIAEGFNLMITFEFNSDRLTEGAQRNLDEFVQAVNAPELRAQRFLIAGHTDSVGSDAYNQALSERRAAAVVAYLVRKGVFSERLIAKGFGETEPLGDRPDDPLNRRVEARLLQ